MSESLERHEQTYQEDAFIFTEEGEGENFYIITEGTVQLLKNTEEGTSHIGSIGPGEVLGEMALIDDEHRRSASAKALTNVTCLEFNPDQFEQLLANNENFREKIMDLLTDRLRETSESLAEVLNLKNKLHEASILIMYLFHALDWYDRSQKTIDLSELPHQQLSSFFRKNQSEINKLTDEPTREDLQDLPLDEMEQLQTSSEEILEKLLDMIHFGSTQESPQSASEDLDEHEQLKQEANELYNSLKNRMDGFEEGEDDEVLQKLEHLESEFQRLRTDEAQSDFLEVKPTIDKIKEEYNRLIAV